MLKILATAALVATLAACSTVGPRNTIKIATGVDSRGNVTWEEMDMLTGERPTGPVSTMSSACTTLNIAGVCRL